ncbi:hypothetical protein P43SY_002338 [Pythium insidiosum]|uniref:Centrosomin N-terminal motif 1 domain-containing protein n=1 Tax=Pythium insidiosum TaxID=114742 RepID=A0AAD5QAN8_PYTIN|nr:hypothetical protein P43SY_002338 [Pythium insidiosum]
METPTTPGRSPRRRPRGLVASPTAALQASTLSATSDGAGDAAATLLREQQAEHNRLQIDNFNLKLRVNYLENRLLQSNKGAPMADPDDLETELHQTRFYLAEREADVRTMQHNMVKAQEVIGALTEELQALQAAKSELERLLAQARDDDSARLERDRAQQRDLERALERLASVEQQLERTQGERDAFRSQAEATSEAVRRLESENARERDAAREWERQHASAMQELQRAQAMATQRDEEARAATELVERARQEQQQTQRKFASDATLLEQQMKQHVEKMEQEHEKMREDLARIRREREELRVAHERVAMELDGERRERSRYHDELERAVQEMKRIENEATALRVQQAKLSTTCDHQAQTIESFKNEREHLMDNLHKLEHEASEWRRQCSEREAMIKSLDRRAIGAEAEVSRLQERVEAVTLKTQQTANEQLQALQQDRLTIERDNNELRKHITALQRQCEALEAKLRATETRLAEESAKTNEWKERCTAGERELRQRSAVAEQLERQLAETTNASASESTQLRQASERVTRLAAERDQLMEALGGERVQLESLRQRYSNLESSHSTLMDQLDALGHEIREIVGYGFAVPSADRIAASDQGSYARSMTQLLRDAKVILQRQFKTQADVISRRWQEDMDAMRRELQRLNGQLQSCHTRVEIAQRSTLHAKDDVRSLDRSWIVKYETLQKEMETMRRQFENELHAERRRAGQLDENLKQARRELESLSQSREAVAENKDLLSALDILKTGIADRDKQIEHYKSNVMKMMQQLQRRGSMGELKQRLLEQLDQTQFMVNETYKRWSHSDIGLGLVSSVRRAGDVEDTDHDHVNGNPLPWILQLDESIGRMDVICDRWREHLQQSRELQRRYADAWRTTAVALGKGKERPAWADDVERRCSRLLTESVRVSEAMRDVVEDVVRAMQHTRESVERRKVKSRSRSRGRSRALDALSPLKEDNNKTLSDNEDEALSLDHFDRSNGDKTMRVNGFTNKLRESSSRQRKSTSRTSTIYSHSIASLGRIGEELQEIERKIKANPE